MKKALIVDDDLIFQMIATKMIQKAGLDGSPKTFVNGKVALEYLLSELPDPSEIIIFLDINMPVMDGWEFLDQLQSNEQLQAYRVIMVTSSTNDSDRQKAKSYAQISDFFIKPLNIEQLQALV